MKSYVNVPKICDLSASGWMGLFVSAMNLHHTEYYWEFLNRDLFLSDANIVKFREYFDL